MLGQDELVYINNSKKFSKLEGGSKHRVTMTPNVNYHLTKQPY